LARPTGQRAVGLRERKKAKTAAAIQSHALRLIRGQGYEATTVEQIIDAAEVSESTFFRYFPTKPSVVLDDHLDPVLGAVFKAQPPQLSAVQALRATFNAVFADLSPQQLEEQRSRTALLVSVPDLRAAFLDQLAGNISLLTGLIAERTGHPPDDSSVRTLAGALMGVTIATMFTMIDDPAADLLALLDQALAKLERGLDLPPAQAVASCDAESVARKA
jgi:AcrR family transcriptional regulator